MTNLESDDTHVSQDLAVLIHEQENALRPSHILKARIEPRAFNVSFVNLSR